MSVNSVYRVVPVSLALSSLLSLLLCGAIFGFFYAWVCSTMWGLDSADPAVAIAAMQAMVDIFPGSEAAQQTWQAFSGKWQIWEGVRTVASGISLTLTGYAILYLHTEKA